MPWQDKLLGSIRNDSEAQNNRQRTDVTDPGPKSTYALCTTGTLAVPHVVCRSRRSHSVCLGTWSLAFLVVGITQLSAGVFFLKRLPGIQLGTNFWTGGWNIACCAAILVISFRCPEVRYLCCSARWPWGGRKSKLVIQGKEFDLLEIPEKSRVKWLLGIGISALLANVINLIVLEVGEWRMAIANEEARFLGKKGFADTMFSAYITATVATSTGVVAGFLCTQFVYCITNKSRRHSRGHSEVEDRSVMSANTQHQSIATISGKFESSEMQERCRHSGRDSSQGWVYSDADEYRLTKIDDMPRSKADKLLRENPMDKINRIATVRRTHSVFMSAPTGVVPNKVSRVQSFKVQPVSTPRVATVQRSKTVHEGSSKGFMADNMRSFDVCFNRPGNQTEAEIENQSEVEVIGDNMERTISVDDLSKPNPNNKFMKLSTKFGDGYARDGNNRSISSTSSIASFAKRYPYAKSIELINEKFPYGDSDADIDTTCDVDTTDVESYDGIVDTKDKNALLMTKQRILNQANRRAITPDGRRIATPDIDYDIRRSDTPLSDSIKDIAMYGKKADLLRVGNMLVNKTDAKVTKEQFKVENKDAVLLSVESKVVQKSEIPKPIKPKRQCERKSSATQTDMSTLRTRPRIAAAIKKVNASEIPEKPQRPAPLPPVENPAEIPAPSNQIAKTMAEQARMSQSQSSSGYSSPQDSYEKSSPEPLPEDTVCHVQDGSSVTVIKIESAKNSQRNATTLHIEDSSKRRMEKPIRKKTRIDIVDSHWVPSNQKESNIPKRSRSRLSMADYGDNFKSKNVGRSVSFNSATGAEWMPLSATLLKEMQTTYLRGEDIPPMPVKPATRKPNIKRSTSSVTLSDMYKNVPAPYFPYANLNLFRLQNLSSHDNEAAWNESDDKRFREGYERFKQGNYVVSDAEEGTSGNVTELETIEETSLETSGDFTTVNNEQHDFNDAKQYPQPTPKLAHESSRVDGMPKFSPRFPNFEPERQPFGMSEQGMPGYGFGNLPTFGYFGGPPFMGGGMGGGLGGGIGGIGGMNPNQAFAYFAELELMARHLRNQLLYQQAQMAQATVAPPPKETPEPAPREESFC